MIGRERAKEIATMYYDDVYRFCLSRLVNEDASSDVTQDVFLLFQEQHERMNDEYIKSWLFTVADFKIKEKFREIARNEKELIFGLVFGGTNGTDEAYEMQQDFVITDEEIEEKKRSILESLTEKELQLFELVYVKHMKYKELAEMLNITEGGLRSKVSRLKAKIQEKATFIFMAILLLVMKILKIF